MQAIRLSRFRKKHYLREWISRTGLSPKDIILPYFVVEGKGIKQEIKSMPGVYQFSIDNIIKDISALKKIKSIILFGIPKVKSNLARQAHKDDGIVQKAVKQVKKNFNELVVITDVCLCGYTTHGHCGILSNNKIHADKTNKVLADIALSHAVSGADIVAPSAMADGQVKAIRNILDKNGFMDTAILAYSAKFASGFYTPFRDAVKSAPQFSNRKSYQMDYRNSDEALREIKQDIDEGADIIMVKPALAYLDIIYRARHKFNVPIAAYNVSGEYSMIKSLANGDKAKEKELALEVLTSIKRAGADFIISYFGKEVLR